MGVTKNLLKIQQPLHVHVHVTRTTRGFLEGVDTELAPIELGSREALWPLVFSPSELPTERLFDEADACPFRC